jgi:hypothetical protein
MNLNVYIASFDGHWLGGYMCAVAETPEDAKKLMSQKANEEVEDRYRPDDFTIIDEVDLDEPNAIVVYDGNY